MATQLNQSSKKNPRKTEPRKGLPNNNWIVWLILGFTFLWWFNQSEQNYKLLTPQKINYSEFYRKLVDNPQTNEIQKLTLSEGTESLLKGKFKSGTDFQLNIPQNDDTLIELIRTNVSDFTVVPEDTFLAK